MALFDWTRTVELLRISYRCWCTLHTHKNSSGRIAQELCSSWGVQVYCLTKRRLSSFLKLRANLITVSLTFWRCVGSAIQCMRWRWGKPAIQVRCWWCGQHGWDRGEIVTVAWPSSFSPIPVYGRLQLCRVA